MQKDSFAHDHPTATYTLRLRAACQASSHLRRTTRARPSPAPPLAPSGRRGAAGAGPPQGRACRLGGPAPPPPAQSVRSATQEGRGAGDASVGGWAGAASKTLSRARHVWQGGVSTGARMVRARCRQRKGTFPARAALLRSPDGEAVLACMREAGSKRVGASAMVIPGPLPPLPVPLACLEQHGRQRAAEGRGSDRSGFEDGQVQASQRKDVAGWHRLRRGSGRGGKGWGELRSQDSEKATQLPTLPPCGCTLPPATLPLACSSPAGAPAHDPS